MKAIEIMTMNPICCLPDAPLKEVASLMVDCHCGAIPVINFNDQPMGMVTDRDIVCRSIAKGLDPLEMTADHCMTQPAVTVSQEATLEECLRLMENDRIRRLIVVDEHGHVSGIISQSDVSRVASNVEIAEIERVVSEPTEEASRIVH